MDQLPYDNLEDLALILQSVSFSKDTKTIQEATHVLQTMAKDSSRFIDSIMKIVTSEKSDQNINRVKKTASAILSRILSPLFDSTTFPQEQKAYILKAVVAGVFSPHVLPTIKATLQQFLIVIYHSDKTGEFKKESLILAQKNLLGGQLNDYGASLFLVHAILEDPLSTQEQVADWFQFLLESLIYSGNAIIEGVGGEILEIIKGAYHEEKITHVFVGLEILKVWTHIINEFIKKLGRFEPSDLANSPRLHILVDKEDIARLLLKILILQIPTGHQIKECLLSTSGVKQLDQLLNSVKAGALKAFELVLEFTLESLPMNVNSRTAPSPILSSTFNKFYVLMQSDGIKAILQSLFQLCRSKYENIEEGIKDKYFNECLVECLTLLAKLTAFQELYTLFSDYKNMIIMDICLPLIASTSEDIRMFKEDPKSFVNLTSGVEEDQDTENVKIQAIQFLKKICDNVDGATSSLVILVGTLIDYSLMSNDPNLMAEQYPKLNDYKESIFITTIQPRIRVEACLLVLHSINEFTIPRKDLLLILESLFSKYHEYFLGAETDPLIKARMCLFLGSYASILFRKEENRELYGQHLKFLIECAGLNNPDQQTVIEQANQTLYEMLGEKDNIMRIHPFVPEVLEKMASYFKYTESLTFFDVVQEIVRIYSGTISKNPQILIVILSSLVERAQIEYDHIKNEKGMSRLALNKIWNIIKIIGEKPEYLLQYQDEIEKVLIPMFLFITSEDEMLFDEDILSYVNSSIKLCKRVSPIVWDIFKAFPKIFEKYQYLLTPLFPALNQIIVYGRDAINENNETIHTLVDIGVHGLDNQHPDSDEASKAIGALYFQLLIQYIGIPNEQWEKMLIVCLAELQKSKKRYLKARLGGVFLLAFLQNFEITEAILINQQALGIVIDLFVNQTVIFESHVYDRKVLLIALSKFITHEGANPLIRERMPQILDVLVSYLKYVQHIEQRSSQPGLKKKPIDYDSDSDEEEKRERLSDKDILANMLGGTNLSAFNNRGDNDNDDEDDEDEDYDDDDDDEDDDEEEIYFPSPLQEANYYVTKLVSDIKAQDEFAVFRDTINQLKQQNPQLLSKLVGTLSEAKKQYMKEVLQSQRIVVNEGQGTTQARIMVKTAGRKIATVPNNN